MAKTIEFVIPDGYQVPEGTDEGDTFEASATFRLKNGKMCLESIDGVAMPGYENEKGEKARAPSAESFADDYAAAMGGGQPMA